MRRCQCFTLAAPGPAARPRALSPPDRNASMESAVSASEALNSAPAGRSSFCVCSVFTQINVVMVIEIDSFHVLKMYVFA